MTNSITVNAVKQ